MNEAAVITLHNRMTEAEYDAERARLGNNRKDAGDRWEQDLARLFAKSGWTQEDLARKEGKSPQQIARQLRFGRFLTFLQIGENAVAPPMNLTEGRFRKYWEKADPCGGNERQRFALVDKAIRADAKGPALPREQSDLGRRIREAFADGKWHDEQAIIDHFPDDDPKDVIQRIKTMQSVGGFKTRAERQKRGRGWRVRLFKQERPVSLAEIQLKLRPLIDGLKAEGRKNEATISIGAVMRLSALLERQLEEWAQDPAADAASEEKKP